jgi:hypothetical protein
MQKKEGGIGIQNLTAVNHGLILASPWRIAEKPNSRLHQILKSKYLTDIAIWRSKPNKPTSTFWTSILKIFHLLQDNSF